MLEWKGLHGFGNELCLKALSWNCQVNHLHCILKSEQIYLNTSTYPVEAVYTFALPRGAVVTNFAIDIGGKHLQAQVTKTQQAAERYEQAIDDDDMPALLEHSEDGLCTLNIGGIAPNETVLIQITCEWMQERVGDIVRVTVPTVIGDRYSLNGSQGQLLPHQQVETSAFAEYPIKAHFEFIGQEYENTRHNIGFRVLDAYAKASNTVFTDGRYGATCRINIKGRTLVLLKPSTYMNLSGNAVRYWLQKENIPNENLLVVVDDIALPVGQLRLKEKGSDGGHNGLAHIAQLIGQNYARLRFGIGNDYPRGGQIDYVLGQFPPEDEKIISEKLPVAAEMITSFCLAGAARTMTQYNNK